MKFKVRGLLFISLLFEYQNKYVVQAFVPITRTPKQIRLMNDNLNKLLLRNNNNNKLSLFNKKDKDPYNSFGELFRIQRRDVFNYDKWVEARSTDRFVGNLLSLFQSGIVKTICEDLWFIVGIATFIFLYNNLLIDGYYDFNNIYHEPIISLPFLPLLKLPNEFFNLMTPALALLLVFRTNTAYKRWDEARKNWGAIVNSSRTIMRESAAWLHENKTITDDEKQKLMIRIEQAVWCFSRSLTRHFLSTREDEESYINDCRTKLRPDLAEDLISARHKPTRALYELSAAINELPIDERRIISIDASITVLCDAMGSSERIFTSPIPRFYTRHICRFAEFWLMLVPLGLYEPLKDSWNHWTIIPTSFFIGFFLLGIEELGIQLEEPFTVLPQHAITENSIGKVATETVQWRKNDFDRMMSAYQNGLQQKTP